MKVKSLIIISVIVTFALFSFAMPNLSKVYGSCEMTKNETLQFAIGYQWTNGLLYIDNAECTWKLFGVVPIASLLSEETNLESFSIVQFAYAGCAATFPPQPCFDSFMMSHEPINQKSIMERFARNIEVNYPDWQMSDRKWHSFDEKLGLPAIICTEFVADGMTHYRMAEWVNEFKISSFEDHRNDWMCNTWLPPVDDGITITWDKSHYLPGGVGTVQVVDKSMNLDDSIIDSIEMHIHSDIDHTGIQLTMTETAKDSGIFEGIVFFTTTKQSSGNTLLVEDAVHASYKENYNFSRIINESEPSTLSLTQQQMIEEYCKTGMRHPDMMRIPQCIKDPQPSDFRESGDNISLLYAYSGLGLVGIVVGFFAIKKWRNRK